MQFRNTVVLLPLVRAVLFWLCMAGSGSSWGQGGRVGLGIVNYIDGGGVSFKYFLDQNIALNWSLNAGGATGFEGTSITSVLTMQYHFYLPDPKLRLYFGGGAYVGNWSGHVTRREREPWVFGVAGVGGFEYFFRTLPLGLFVAFYPKVGYLPYTQFFSHNLFGIGGHYYFGRKIKAFQSRRNF